MAVVGAVLVALGVGCGDELAGTGTPEAAGTAVSSEATRPALAAEARMLQQEDVDGVPWDVGDGFFSVNPNLTTSTELTFPGEDRLNADFVQLVTNASGGGDTVVAQVVELRTPESAARLVEYLRASAASRRDYDLDVAGGFLWYDEDNDTLSMAFAEGRFVHGLSAGPGLDVLGVNDTADFMAGVAANWHRRVRGR